MENVKLSDMLNDNKTTLERAETLKNPEEISLENNADNAAVVDETHHDPARKILGTVVNCIALNIRKKPSIDSEVVYTVKAGNDLVINNLNPAPDWYSVTEKYGFTGFVMSKYVEIKNE